MFCCDICGKVYEKKCVLFRHTREVHKIRCFQRDPATVKREAQCSLCSRKYANSATLKRHLRLVHAAAAEKFSCNDCSYECSSRVGVLRHITKNHQPATSEDNRRLEKSLIQIFNIQSLSDIEEWLENFKAEHHIFLRKMSTKQIKNTNAKVVHRAKYRCVHGERLKKDSTSCPFRIFIRVKRVENPPPPASMDSFSVNPTVLYAEVKITNKGHNHEIDDAAWAKFRRVSEDVREKFIAYFGRGFTPLKALKEYDDELRREYSTKDYHTIQGDRFYCPDITWVRRLYYKVGYGPRLSRSLSKKASSSNEEHNKSGRVQMKSAGDITLFAPLQGEVQSVERITGYSSFSHEAPAVHSSEDSDSLPSPVRSDDDNQLHDDDYNFTARNEERQKASKMIESFRDFSKIFVDRISNNKPLLLASQAMIENYGKLLRTDSALESAMRTFGKYRGPAKKKNPHTKEN